LGVSHFLAEAQRKKAMAKLHAVYYHVINLELINFTSW
jgi:hypothetical protein